MKLRNLYLSTMLAFLLVAAPAAGRTTVHFASVFDANGIQINRVWLVGVDCGDGVVQGAGLCAGDPATCVDNAIDRICSSGSETSPGSGGASGGPPDLDFDETIPAEAVGFSTYAIPRYLDPNSILPDFTGNVPDWQAELADRITSNPTAQRPLAVATMASRIAGIFDCRMTCYYWGPGCPCWERQNDWLSTFEPVLRHVSDIASGALFDVISCVLRAEAETTDTSSEGRLNRARACARNTPSFCSGPTQWTDWLDRDNPSGSGDFETLAEFQSAGQVCDAPLNVECETLDGRPWTEVGQQYSCRLDRGGVCRNQGQNCLDYRVRFLCPTG